MMIGRARRTDALEWWSAVVTLGWAGILFLPGNTFSTTPAYSVLETVGGENFWESLCVCVALIQIGGLLSPYWAGGREGRIIGAGFGAMFWGVLAALLAAGNPIGHGWFLYASLSLGLAYAAVSLWSEDSGTDGR